MTAAEETRRTAVAARAANLHTAYMNCRRDPCQPIAVRRDAVLYLAAIAATHFGVMPEADELLYRRCLAPTTLLDPMGAFLALVFEICAPSVPVALDRILPLQAAA